MSAITSRRRGMLGALVCAFAFFTVGTAEAHLGPHTDGLVSDIQLVAENIGNPRNLAVDTNGDLYIPASGSGGTEACGAAGPGPMCSGLSGSILKVTRQQLANVALGPAKPTVLATRLVSTAYPGGSNANGVQGVVARKGVVHAVFISPEFIGKGGSGVCCRSDVKGPLRDAAMRQLGNLMRVGPGGTLTKIADIDDFEFANNPVNDPNSNPYAVAIDRDGTFVIADAAANSLVRADKKGRVRLIAAFDNITPGPSNVRTEAVPTGVAVGPDGNYYVSLLAGQHPTFARILQVTPAGVIRTIADGFTSLAGIAVAPGGTVYATQLLNGGIVRVTPDPERPGRFMPPVTLYQGQLVSPTGLAIGPDGWLYVSVDSIFGQDDAIHGRVVRVRG